ncbi:Gfo/Idh/MocA family protein [Roseburia faecis]|uniref:Gfo/Idh/MocA family protein n=1 Tax=Roseburia faecis TaxID=301302 RepID=UPI00189919C1|nr:Gfo/Idh/MocA family oxidoreductase [Roseburia faecis]
MNKKGEVCLGVAGAGRATELHMNALKRNSGVPVCYKHIIARRMEQVNAAKERYGFINASLKFDDLLNDPEIDVIDICTPPYAHEDMIIRALEAGKHVICEKPLTGYFGLPGDKEPIGKYVSKSVMYEEVLKSIDRIKKVIDRSEKKFMYAENFVYAPAVIKSAEIIRKKKSKILYAKGEESLKGSSSPVAGEWSKTGGGTFIRTGAHPLSAILWLKQQEALTRGEEITVQSVFADMGQITSQLSEYEHRHIAARPNDVEDTSTVILTFSDGTKATVIATDTLLGGSKNYVELYCNDAAITCNLTMSDLMSTYFLDEERLDDVYISEMLPSKTGWNHPFLEDEIIRGYMDEMRDFMEAVYFDRDPKSSFSLAYDTVKIIYAAYKSAELGVAVQP